MLLALVFPLESPICLSDGLFSTGLSISPASLSAVSLFWTPPSFCSFFFVFFFSFNALFLSDSLFYFTLNISLSASFLPLFLPPGVTDLPWRSKIN